MSKLVIIPDMHNRIDEPKHSACNDFMDWFASSEYNIESSTLLFQGDLSEKASPESDVNDELHDFIERRCKANKKIILVGNHDLSLSKGYQYKYLRSKFITIVDTPCSMKIDNLNCLMLPHYDYIQSEIKVPMYEYYNNLPEELANQKYDFAFGHVMTENKLAIDNKYFCDLSYLDISCRVFGHYHLFNKNIGGDYLGSVTLNSISERGKTPYIAVIDTNTKEIEYIQVPKFMDYYDVTYPESLPELKFKYNLITINEAIHKEEAIKFYTEQADIQNKTFYLQDCNLKKLKEEIDFRSEEEGRSNIEYFLEMAQDKKIDKKVCDIVIEQLNKI